MEQAECSFGWKGSWLVEIVKPRKRESTVICQQEFKKNNLHSQPPGYYIYPEIVQPPGIITRKLLREKTFFREYLHENKIFFKNILGGYSRAYVLLIHEKNRARKSHATVSLIDWFSFNLPSNWFFKRFLRESIAKLIYDYRK